MKKNSVKICRLYCFNCRYSFRTKKSRITKKVCRNKDFCGYLLHSEETRVIRDITVKSIR